MISAVYFWTLYVNRNVEFISVWIHLYCYMWQYFLIFSFCIALLWKHTMLFTRWDLLVPMLLGTFFYSVSFSVHNSIEFIPEEELLVTTVIDATLGFSKIAVPLYALFSTIWELYFFHRLSDSVLFAFFKVAMFPCLKKYQVLIWIPLMTKNPRHFL